MRILIAAALMIIVLFALLVAPASASDPTPLPAATRQPTYTPLPTATRRVFSSATATATAAPTPVISRVEYRPPAPNVHPGPDDGLAPPPRSGLGLAAVIGGGALVLVPLAGVLVLAVRRGNLLQLAVAWRAQRNSPQQRELAQLRKEQKKRQATERKQLRQIAKHLARVTTDVLTGVKYCHIYRNQHGRKKVQKVSFTNAIVIGGEQILLRLGRVPYGHTRWELFANAPGSGANRPVESGTAVVSWYATELYLALGRQVEIVFYEDLGIFFQIGLKQGIAGVPKRVWWRDPEGKKFSMMEGDPLNEGKGGMRDAEKYPGTRLYFPVGLGRNRAVIRKDLRNQPHLIVSGTTGSGKSNFLNQMICTWLERNTPATLQLYLIDLKVVEFAHFLALSTDDGAEGQKSIVANVVQNEKEATAELEFLYREIERRQQLMKGVCVNIEGWNQQKPHARMPYIVCIFDELSLVMLSHDRKLASAAKRFTAKCLAVGRSSGVHMILCTQVINSQIVDMLITANTPGKMIFRQATRSASINALGDGRAWTHLEQSGMGYFCDAQGKEHLVQSPLILESQRDDVIATILERMQGAPEQKSIIVQAWQYALDNYDGSLRQRDMWEEYFRDFIGKDRFQALIREHFWNAETWQPVLELNGDGEHWRCIPARRGVAAHVEPVRYPLATVYAYTVCPEIEADEIEQVEALPYFDEVEDDEDEPFDYEEYKQIMEIFND